MPFAGAYQAACIFLTVAMVQIHYGCSRLSLGESIVRKGDAGTRNFDSSESRLVREDGLWSFQSREGVKGPYLSRLDAEKAISNYAETMEYLDDRRVPPQFNSKDVTVIMFDQRLERGRDDAP